VAGGGVGDTTGGNLMSVEASNKVEWTEPSESVDGDTSALTDEQLVQRVRGGDRQAFGVLVVRYQDRIFNLVYRMCGRHAEAEELAQEAFLRALERIDQFAGRSRFYTWLFRIAANLTISHQRRRQRVRFHSMDAGQDDRPDDGVTADIARRRAPDPVEAAVAGETRDRVAEALAAMDEPFRIVLVLRDMQDMDYAEMADVLDVPVGTIKSRLFRARRLLRDELKDLRP